MVVVNEGIVFPECLSCLFSRDDFTRMFQEQEQELDRLLLELDRAPVLPERTGARIDFVVSKADEVCRHGGPLDASYRDYSAAAKPSATNWTGSSR